MQQIKYWFTDYM